MRRCRTFPGRRSRGCFGLFLACALSACATGAGTPAAHIAEPAIAAAYRPLYGRLDLGLRPAAGAAMVVLPGVAVTNAHNADLLDGRRVLGEAAQSDLLFFAATGTPPPTAPPAVGEAITAYGQDTDRKLRIAHGVVREIVKVPGYSDSPYFTFSGDAGPGFSGGPVVDGEGRLIGITFGYKELGKERLVFAYGIDRIRAEFSRLPKRPASASN